MHKVSQILLIVGVLGLLITAGLNVYAAHGGDSNSTLFSAGWWTRWFVVYFTNASMLLIGIVMRLAARSAG